MIPRNAQQLADDARAAGHTVIVDEEDGHVAVRITIDDFPGESAPEQYHAAWRRIASGGWRMHYATDGWSDGNMTLTALRSFTT